MRSDQRGEVVRAKNNGGLAMITLPSATCTLIAENIHANRHEQVHCSSVEQTTMKTSQASCRRQTIRMEACLSPLADTSPEPLTG